MQGRTERIVQQRQVAEDAMADFLSQKEVWEGLIVLCRVAEKLRKIVRQVGDRTNTGEKSVKTSDQRKRDVIRNVWILDEIEHSIKMAEVPCSIYGSMKWISSQYIGYIFISESGFCLSKARKGVSIEDKLVSG